MKAILLIITTLFFSICSAQISKGYLGRKFLVEVTANTSFSGANRAFNFSPYSISKTPRLVKSFKAWTVPELSLGMLLSKNISMGIELNYMRHTFILNDFNAVNFPGYFNYNVSVQETNYNGAFYYPEDFYGGTEKFIPNQSVFKTNAFGANAFLELFMGRRITPFKIGHRLHFGFIMSKMSGADMIEGEYGVSGYEIQTEIRNSRNFYYKIGYSLNRRFVLKSGFYIKAAFALNVVLKSRKIGYSENYSWYYQHFIYQTEKAFLDKALRFQIKLGIGKI